MELHSVTQGVLLALISYNWITDIPLYRQVKLQKSRAKQSVCGHTTSVTMQKSQCISSLSYRSLKVELHASHLCWVLCIHMYKQMYFCSLFVWFPTSTSPGITADQACGWVREMLTHEMSTSMKAAISQDCPADVGIQGQILPWEEWTGFLCHQQCCVSWATVRTWLTLYGLNQAKGL